MDISNRQNGPAINGRELRSMSIIVTIVSQAMLSIPEKISRGIVGRIEPITGRAIRFLGKRGWRRAGEQRRGSEGEGHLDEKRGEERIPAWMSSA